MLFRSTIIGGILIRQLWIWFLIPVFPSLSIIGVMQAIGLVAFIRLLSLDMSFKIEKVIASNIPSKSPVSKAMFKNYYLLFSYITIFINAAIIKFIMVVYPY